MNVTSHNTLVILRKDYHGHIQHKITLVSRLFRYPQISLHTLSHHSTAQVFLLLFFIRQFTKTRTYVTFLLYLPSAALFHSMFDSDSLVKFIANRSYYFSHPCTLTV